MKKPILYYKYGDRHCLQIDENIKLTNYKNILKDSIHKHDIYIKLNMNDTNIEEKSFDYGKIGFFYPHVVTSENEPFILLKLTRDNFEKDYSQVLPKFCEFIIHSYNDYVHKEIACQMNLRISKSCLEKLYELVFINSDNNKPQMEFAGQLRLESIAMKSRLVWKIGTEKDLSDLETGKSDNVEGPNQPFTFHTHPYKTYGDFHVKYAWPSKTDYESIWALIVEMDGLCHFVATVEGIYCVSINNEWASRIDELKQMKEEEINKMLKHYQEDYISIDSKEKYNPKDYVNNVNKRSQTLDLPFMVQFRKWENATDIIKINVPIITKDNEMSCKSVNLVTI